MYSWATPGVYYSPPTHALGNVHLYRKKSLSELISKVKWAENQLSQVFVLDSTLRSTRLSYLHKVCKKTKTYKLLSVAFRFQENTYDLSFYTKHKLLINLLFLAFLPDFKISKDFIQRFWKSHKFFHKICKTVKMSRNSRDLKLSNKIFKDSQNRIN